MHAYDPPMDTRSLCLYRKREALFIFTCIHTYTLYKQKLLIPVCVSARKTQKLAWLRLLPNDGHNTCTNCWFSPPPLLPHSTLTEGLYGLL